VKKSRIVAAIGLGVAALLVGIALDYFNRDSVAHQSIQLHLRLTGEAIYEYHSRTGRWPARIDDLAETSLPLKSPYWRQLVEQGTIAVVWRSDLKPDPKDNAHLVLAYHNQGLFARLGRVWVCWGDLRTEYVKAGELRSQLQSAGK
jgi:hypothetical protein